MDTETGDNQPEDGDRYETLIEAAIDVYNSVQALWAAQAVVFSTDEAPESILANLAAHGLDNAQIADLFAIMARHTNPLQAQSGQQQVKPRITHAAGVNYSDSEWSALGWRAVSIVGKSRLMMRDGADGPEYALANRWGVGHVPHGRHFSGKKG